MDGSMFLSAMVNKTSNKALFSGRVLTDMGYRDLRAIWGPVWGTGLRVDSRVNSGSILDHI